MPYDGDLRETLEAVLGPLLIDLVSVECVRLIVVLMRQIEGN